MNFRHRYINVCKKERKTVETRKVTRMRETKKRKIVNLVGRTLDFNIFIDST